MPTGNRVLMFNSVTNNISNVVTDLNFPDATLLSVYNLEVRNQVRSNVAMRTITTDYTAAYDDALIIANNTASITISLNPAVGLGKEFIVKNINSGSVVLDANVIGGSLIDGETQQTLSQWDSITIIDSAAGQWYIV